MKPNRLRVSLNRQLKLSANGTSVFQQGGQGDVLRFAFKLSNIGAGDVHPLGDGLLGESGILTQLAQLFAKPELGQIVLNHFFELRPLGYEFAFELSECLHVSCLSACSSRPYAPRRF